MWRIINRVPVTSEAAAQTQKAELSKAGDKEYKLVSGDPGDKQSIFITRLVKLADKVFLDVKPDPASEPDCSGLPWHMFFYVPQIEPKLRMLDLNDKWLEKLLKKKRPYLNTKSWTETCFSPHLQSSFRVSCFYT